MEDLTVSKCNKIIRRLMSARSRFNKGTIDYNDISISINKYQVWKEEIRSDSSHMDAEQILLGIE